MPGLLGCGHILTCSSGLITDLIIWQLDFHLKVKPYWRLS